MNWKFIISRVCLVLISVGAAVTTLGQGTLTVQVGAPPAPPTPLVSHGDAWRFHKGTNAPQADWKTAADASLNATWGSGPGGIGYADNTTETSQCQTLLTDMLNRYTTVYLRRSFDVAEAPDPARRLLLTMDWDDGFVAYLDGAELQRSLAPGAVGVEPAYTATATTTHESSRGNSGPQPAVTYDLGQVGSQLPPGTHTLAVLGLNAATNSSDFIQIVDFQLTGASSAVTGGPYLSLVQSNYVILTGSNTVAGSARVVVNGDDAAFDRALGTWSKSQSLAPGVNDLFIAALDSSGAILASTNRRVVSELSSTGAGGTLPANTTWNPSQGIIHVTNTVVVPAAGTLTIDPGTVVLLSPGASITGTNAALTAPGTAGGGEVFFLPADGATVWGGLVMSGTGGSLTLQHVETVAGHVELFDGAAGTIEDSYLHDYEVSSPAIVHTLGAPNHVTLNLRRSHVAHYYEILSQLAVNHIEDCLCEIQAAGGDGIDFDGAQPGSTIRRCTVRRGLFTNIDALDMGEYGGTGEGSHGVLIDSCLLHDFVDKGVSMGIQVDVAVTNTLIYNVDSGIAVKDNSVAGIYNCTIADANFGFHCYNKADPTANTGGGHITNSFNNLLWNTGTTLSFANGSTLVASYSDLQATNFPGTGDIDADPLFLNPAAHDYRVATNSPTLGAGLGGANLGVTLPVGGIPGAPLALAALASGTDPVTLTWTDDADNETGFALERSTDAKAWQPLGTTSANAAAYTDTGALQGQKYYYRVKATNSSGDSAWSNIASGIRQAPQTFVGGAVTADTTWSAGGHYVVTNSLNVNAGVTLTIPAGAQVCFDAGQGLTVANGGRLLAQGTTNAPILFTRFGTGGNWANLTINGAVGSPESRITWADFEFNASSTGTPCIQVSAGAVFLDHLTFRNPAAPYIHVDGASFVISHCYFPAPTAAFEPCHGTEGVRRDGHGVFLRNFFGKPTGYNDVVDFTGGNRPNPIVHFIQNVVTGGDDDGFDLDGTDAWVEGNLFLHLHKNGGTPDSSSAVSGGNFTYGGGDPGGVGTETSEVTVIGNLIYDCDEGADAKQGNFFTMINNTIVHQTHAGGVDTDGAVVILADTGTAQGAGIYLEGNIVEDAENLTRNVTTAIVTFTNNIIPFEWTGPGGDNSTNNPALKQIPQLADTYFTNWADAQVLRDWFSLLPGSPGIATGPNGLDKGGVIPIGASVSGEPQGTTPDKAATLVVGPNRTGNGIPAQGWPNGSGYVAYKWRLDGGTWSAETPIDLPISLSGLADGPHFVEVIGKRDSGLYQDDPVFGEAAVVTASRTWTVQSAQPPLQIDSAVPAGDGLQIHFVAQAGATYTVQYRDAFDAAHPWTRLQDVPAQPAAGSVQVTDPNSHAAERYYRIVAPAQP